MKTQIKLWFKFNKYSFIELGWTIGSLICDILVARHWWGNLFTPLHIVWWVIAVPWTFFGFYRVWESFRSYKYRIEDYLRVTEMFQKYGVKKSVLYNLQQIPCSATVAEQLVKDWDVKDVHLYTDDL